MRGFERVVWQDLIIVALATGVVSILCDQFDLSEALRRWTAPWERFQLDELPEELVVLAGGLVWFAVRRYREARRELRRREFAEAQLEVALTNNRRLSQQYVQLQEAERKSLARELHDELGQYLNVIKLDAVGIRDGRSSSAGVPSEHAEAIVANCNHIHTALATLIRQLRPVALDDLGLAAALEHCVDTWRPRLPDTQLDLTLTGDFDDLNEAVTLTAYRVVQEGLNNVAKHAAASQVVLRLVRDRVATGEDVVIVTVIDDGVGTDTSKPTPGLGLIGMRERVVALAGQLKASSVPGQGFELQARIPVHCAQQGAAARQVG
jgi:two-component system, NarL family, sensor histidine kinase UhpB